MQGNFEPRNSSAAMWSLVLGILSFMCFGALAGIPAVICGHAARGNIRNSGGRLTGDGMAVGGLILGYLSIVLTILALILMFLIALPNFIQARNSAQTTTCIANLKQIHGAKHTWAIQESVAEDARPTKADLDPYFTGSIDQVVCPLGTSFDDSYEIESLENVPRCKKDPARHTIDY